MVICDCRTVIRDSPEFEIYPLPLIRTQRFDFQFFTMVSFEDYDEFGNYIGADLGSENEEDEAMETGFGEASRHEAAPALEGYEEEPMQTEEAGALMEVEGKSVSVTYEEI